MRFLDIAIIDPQGPVVEVKFFKTIETAEDIREVVKEAGSFVEEHFPRGTRGYFLNCYDNLRIPLALVDTLKEEFLKFNQKYSYADVRYGGTISAKAFWISTAVKEGIESAFYTDRDEAMRALRGKMGR